MTIRRSDYENYDYREFWSGQKRLYEDTSEKLALKKMMAKDSPNNSVFADVGCGYGRLFSLYENFSTIILIDYSLKNLHIAKNNIAKYLNYNPGRLASIHFIAADASRLPLREATVDTLLSVRLVHHLPQPELYFKQAARVLKPEGTYILEFANKRNSKNIIRAMLGKMDTSPFSLTPSRIGETIQNYHPRYIKDILNRNGFKIIRRLSVSNFRLQAIKRVVPLKLLMFLEDIYQNAFSFISLGPSIFLKSVLEKPRNMEHGNQWPQMLACPHCGNPGLDFYPQQVKCRGCKKIYPVEEGIYNFRVG